MSRLRLRVSGLDTLMKVRAKQNFAGRVSMISLESVVHMCEFNVQMGWVCVFLWVGRLKYAGFFGKAEMMYTLVGKGSYR